VLRRHVLAGLLACLLPFTPATAAEPVTVFAAASLTDAMRDVSAVWQQAGHAPLRLSFASSSTLARQIDQGGPANLFASADQQWMDYLAQRNQIAAGTRRDLLANRLVLIVPKDQERQVEVGPGLDLIALLGPTGRIATGDPAHVPVGIYAKQALTALGQWAAVEPRLARTDDVRGALLLVERRCRQPGRGSGGRVPGGAARPYHLPVRGDAGRRHARGPRAAAVPGRAGSAGDL